MPERNNADVPALIGSTLHRWLEAVPTVIKGNGPMPDVTQLGFPIPLKWDFWVNHNQAGTDVQPAESTEPLQWREVGWIFRQGECIAIEGKGPEVRARMMVT